MPHLRPAVDPAATAADSARCAPTTAASQWNSVPPLAYPHSTVSDFVPVPPPRYTPACSPVVPPPAYSAVVPPVTVDSQSCTAQRPVATATSTISTASDGGSTAAAADFSTRLRQHNSRVVALMRLSELAVCDAVKTIRRAQREGYDVVLPGVAEARTRLVAIARLLISVRRQYDVYAAFLRRLDAGSVRNIDLRPNNCCLEDCYRRLTEIHHQLRRWVLPDDVSAQPSAGAVAACAAGMAAEISRFANDFFSALTAFKSTMALTLLYTDSELLVAPAAAAGRVPDAPRAVPQRPADGVPNHFTTDAFDQFRLSPGTDDQRIAERLTEDVDRLLSSHQSRSSASSLPNETVTTSAATRAAERNNDDFWSQSFPSLISANLLSTPIDPPAAQTNSVFHRFEEGTTSSSEVETKFSNMMSSESRQHRVRRTDLGTIDLDPVSDDADGELLPASDSGICDVHVAPAVTVATDTSLGLDLFTEFRFPPVDQLTPLLGGDNSNGDEGVESHILTQTSDTANTETRVDIKPLELSPLLVYEGEVEGKPSTTLPSVSCNAEQSVYKTEPTTAADFGVHLSSETVDVKPSQSVGWPSMSFVSEDSDSGDSIRFSLPFASQESEVADAAQQPQRPKVEQQSPDQQTLFPHQPFVIVDSDDDVDDVVMSGEQKAPPTSTEPVIIEDNLDEGACCQIANVFSLPTDGNGDEAAAVGRESRLLPQSSETASTETRHGVQALELSGDDGEGHRDKSSTNGNAAAVNANDPERATDDGPRPETAARRTAEASCQTTPVDNELMSDPDATDVGSTSNARTELQNESATPQEVDQQKRPRPRKMIKPAHRHSHASKRGNQGEVRHEHCSESPSQERPVEKRKRGRPPGYKVCKKAKASTEMASSENRSVRSPVRPPRPDACDSSSKASSSTSVKKLVASQCDAADSSTGEKAKVNSGLASDTQLNDVIQRETTQDSGSISAQKPTTTVQCPNGDAEQSMAPVVPVKKKRGRPPGRRPSAATPSAADAAENRKTASKKTTKITKSKTRTDKNFDFTLKTINPFCRLLDHGRSEQQQNQGRSSLRIWQSGSVVNLAPAPSGPDGERSAGRVAAARNGAEVGLAGEWKPAVSKKSLCEKSPEKERAPASATSCQSMSTVVGQPKSTANQQEEQWSDVEPVTPPGRREPPQSTSPQQKKKRRKKSLDKLPKERAPASAVPASRAVCRPIPTVTDVVDSQPKPLSKQYQQHQQQQEEQWWDVEPVTPPDRRAPSRPACPEQPARKPTTMPVFEDISDDETTDEPSRLLIDLDAVQESSSTEGASRCDAAANSNAIEKAKLNDSPVSRPTVSGNTTTSSRPTVDNEGSKVITGVDNSNRDSNTTPPAIRDAELPSLKFTIGKDKLTGRSTVKVLNPVKPPPNPDACNSDCKVPKDSNNERSKNRLTSVPVAKVKNYMHWRAKKEDGDSSSTRSSVSRASNSTDSSSGRRDDRRLQRHSHSRKLPSSRQSSSTDRSTEDSRSGSQHHRRSKERSSKSGSSTLSAGFAQYFLQRWASASQKNAQVAKLVAEDCRDKLKATEAKIMAEVEQHDVILDQSERPTSELTKYEQKRVCIQLLLYSICKSFRTDIEYVVT